jgi:hypothetical protein
MRIAARVMTLGVARLRMKIQILTLTLMRTLMPIPTRMLGPTQTPISMVALTLEWVVGKVMIRGTPLE